jgi:hypothetical protein
MFHIYGKICMPLRPIAMLLICFGLSIRDEVVVALIQIKKIFVAYWDGGQEQLKALLTQRTH